MGGSRGGGSVKALSTNSLKRQLPLSLAGCFILSVSASLAPSVSLCLSVCLSVSLSLSVSLFLSLSFSCHLDFSDEVIK